MSELIAVLTSNVVLDGIADISVCCFADIIFAECPRSQLVWLWLGRGTLLMLLLLLFS